MKKFKRVLRALGLTSVLGMSCLALGSCEQQDTNHTITFYTTMGEKLQAPLNESIAAFEAKFPGWEVEAIFPGGYDEVKSAIVGDLQANSQPDLAYCYADHVAQYLVTGKVVNISKFVDNQNPLVATVKENNEWVEKTYENEIVGYTEAEVKDLVPGYYAEGYAKNYANFSSYGYTEMDLLTLPFQKSTEILYYNADALEELGVEVPQTWDELWDVCRKAKAKWPQSTPLGYDSESNWFITMCEQNGWGYTSAQNPHYLFNNAQTQAWLTELNGYFNEGLFTTQEIYGAYSSNLFTKGAETGSILSIGSSGGASYQDPGTKFDWGVAPIPGSKLADGTVVKKAISQGPSLVMFETSATNADEKQLMTWEFVKFLLDPQYQCKFAGTSGYMPARISAYEVPYYQELLEDTTNIVVATVLCAKTMTDNYYTSPAFVGSSTARTQVGSALVYAAMGTKSAQAALSDAAKKCGA